MVTNNIVVYGLKPRQVIVSKRLVTSLSEAPHISQIWLEHIQLEVDWFLEEVLTDHSTWKKKQTLTAEYLKFTVAAKLPIRYFVCWTAARARSTLGPREQNPCSSGGLTVIRAASRGTIPRRNSNGVSPRKIGVQSALPSFTALRALAPMNNEFDRKIPVKKRNKQQSVQCNIHTNCSQLYNISRFTEEKTHF